MQRRSWLSIQLIGTPNTTVYIIAMVAWAAFALGSLHPRVEELGVEGVALAVPERVGRPAHRPGMVRGLPHHRGRPRTRHGSAGTAAYLLAGAHRACWVRCCGRYHGQVVDRGPSLVNLINAPEGEFEARLVNAYAATRYVGAATVAVLVTVMRDSVLVLALAFITFGCAYLWG